VHIACSAGAFAAQLLNSERVPLRLHGITTFEPWWLAPNSYSDNEQPSAHETHFSYMRRSGQAQAVVNAGKVVYYASASYPSI
jgi:hypothetical protein